jgi:hypothetical protein
MEVLLRREEWLFLNRPHIYGAVIYYEWNGVYSASRVKLRNYLTEK